MPNNEELMNIEEEDIHVNEEILAVLKESEAF